MLLASSAVFGVVYLLVFPTLLAVLLRRHWQKYIANAPATMLDVNGGPNDDDNDIADAKAVPLDGEPVIDDNLPGSPLVSVVSSSMWDTVALPRRHGPLWYDMLISGWSQKQPFAELLWLARRFACKSFVCYCFVYFAHFSFRLHSGHGVGCDTPVL